MSDAQEKIRQAFERKQRALEAKPAFGRGTAVTRVTLVGGLACDVEEGKWRLRADMSEVSGGTESGPNPGILGRAALGTCLAIGYAQEAALNGITFDRLDVEVQADYDAGGMYGTNDATPGYSQVRCLVTVESDAPAEEIEALLDEADAHSSYLDVFTRAIDVRRELKILRSTATGDG